ncbi:MAG: NADP-dependent oxidoreductase [Aquabacterium sp.]|nr:NADP-dependent oxidoreductase [Aquabacterium sp.]
MNQRIALAQRPSGWVDESCFALESCAEPAVGPEDVLLAAIYLSTDPYLRGRMNAGPSYAPGFALGQPIVSRVVARVIASNNARFQVGDVVWGFLAWAQRSVAPRGEGLHKIDPALGRISHAVSALGMPGLTAWVGAIEIGRPSPGDTVYISSAAGAVGQLAGQFAQRAGARVVGSAGSDDKVAYVRERCGFDAAFNYKTTDLDQALRTHCPNGIDVYFDNVGGATLEAALRHANVGARFPVCGMISAYNEVDDAGIRGLQAVLTKRITMTGFIIYDHVHKLAAYQARVAPWLRSGELVFHEDIVQGLEHAPAALIGMMKGEAIGKRLVQVAAEDGAG